MLRPSTPWRRGPSSSVIRSISGQGAALQTGIVYALRQGAEVVGTLDADGQHSAADLQRMGEALMRAEPTSRSAAGFSARAEGLPFARRIVLNSLSPSLAGSLGCVSPTSTTGCAFSRPPPRGGFDDPEPDGARIGDFYEIARQRLRHIEVSGRSGTLSIRWRRAKKSATLSELSARFFRKRSRDDYPGPADARARRPHSVRLRSKSDIPPHPRRNDYHWSSMPLISCGCPTTRMTLPTSSGSGAAPISSLLLDPHQFYRHPKLSHRRAVQP